MRILLVNQFYPPDLAPTGQLLRDLALRLAGRGHEVTVICSAHTYAAGGGAAPSGSVREVRVGGRGEVRKGVGGTLSRYLAFHVAAYRAVRGLEVAPDVVVAMTTPPLIGLTIQWALRGKKVVHVQWLMDLYPHVLVAHGFVREGSMIHRVLLALTRRQLHNTAWVAAPCSGMANRVRLLLGARKTPDVVSVPLWAAGGLAPWPESTPVPLRKQRKWRDDETIFLYSGNLGLGHSVEEFLDVARALHATEGLRWVFAGDRNRLVKTAEYARAHPEARIECMPYVDEADLRQHLCSADIHLVSLRDCWSDLIMPSKLQAAFAVGRPVLFVGPSDSDPARWIRESGGGWIVSGDNRNALACVALECRSFDERRRRGTAAYRFACEHFNRDENCARLVDLIEKSGRGESIDS